MRFTVRLLPGIDGPGDKISPREWLFTTMLLLFVGYLAFGLYFAPALFMDDWTSVVERIVTNNAQWVDFSQRRPWLFSTFLLQNQLLGLNIPAYYVSLWLLYILQSLTLYAIIRRLPLPQGRTFALLVALLYLVYPTNYTHMWLIMFGVYLATWLTLLAGYFFLRYGQTGRWRYGLPGLLCLIYPLGIYEGQLGIVAVWALLLALLWPNLPRERRLVLLLPLGILALFGLWRIVGLQSVGVTDEYVGRVITAPGALLERLLLGYKISFLWGWTEPIIAVLDPVTSLVPALLLLGGVTVLCLAVAWLLSRWRAPAGATAEDNGTTLRVYLLLALLGIVLTGAGYIPIIFVFLPSLAGIGSRFNLFATVGGAVALASCLMLLAQLLARQGGRPRWLALAGATPFLLLAVAFHASVQRHNQLAWEEQQQLWQQLFLQAPDIADDSLVLFILPDMEDRTGFVNWRRTPLSASWEAASGVRLLYDNSSLVADVYFPDIDEPIEPFLGPDGVLTQETAEVTPYERVVAFRFRAATGTLEQLEQLPASLIEESDRPVFLCQDCVLSEPVTDVAWRRLVLD